MTSNVITFISVLYLNVKFLFLCNESPTVPIPYKVHMVHMSKLD